MSRRKNHEGGDAAEDVMDDVGEATSKVADAAGHVADEVGEGVRKVSEDLSGGGGSQGSEFSAKLGELRTLLAELARSAPAAASGSFDDLKAKATEFCEACEGKVSDATKAVVRTVKERPGQTLMAAVGAGLLTWWLLSRSHHDQHGRKG